MKKTTLSPSKEQMCRKTHISNEANEPKHLQHMCQPYMYRLENEYINDCNDADVISLPKPRDRCHVACAYVQQLDPPKPSISAKNAQRVEHKVEEVQRVFVQVMQLYKPNEIMFSFNGGKDCTVVLDMLCRFYRNICLQHLEIPVLYIQTEDMFPEVEEFVDKCAERYAIELVKYKGGMKEAILHMMYEFPAVKAVVMGLRSSDPHCQNLRVMQHTDPGWPPLMRINPILDWTYCDVWNYLLYYNIPYCALYDQGYTSLGNKSNTRRNEHLRCVNPECTEPAYFPAYYLEDGARERDGRL